MSNERPNGMRSNAENILRATLGEAVEYDNPNSPVEYYLVKLKEAIEAGGGGMPSDVKYAANLSLTIDSSTFVVTAQLIDQNGDDLGTAQTIDLPLESVVVGGSYNDQTKKVVLTLQNRNTVEFSVADLVAGLQSELTATNKLNPAFINYDSTHAAVTEAQRTQIGTNQAAIDGQQNTTAQGGNGYAIINGIRLYVSSTAPTGDIPDGSVGVGW